MGIDSWHNNSVGGLLELENRTTGTESARQENYNSRGVILYTKVASTTGTASLTLALEGQDAINDEYQSLASLATTLNSTGSLRFLFYPDSSTGGDFDEVANIPIPRDWRLSVTADNTDSITYSVAYGYVL